MTCMYIHNEMQKIANIKLRKTLPDHFFKSHKNCFLLFIHDYYQSWEKVVCHQYVYISHTIEPDY